MSQEGVYQAVRLIKRALIPEGFVASPTEKDNYRRVWTRDGVIVSLAALLLDDSELISGVNSTLETIASNQGPHGEIPSNVSPSGEISYGGLAGRVDAPLWYVIGVCAYLRKTGNQKAVIRHRSVVEKALFIAGCWEFNNRGLIYSPLSGDWADEFVLSGYTLISQILYFLALKGFRELFEEERYAEKEALLRELIRKNYWIASETGPGVPYHPKAYEEVLRDKNPRPYWLASLDPAGYTTLFDGLANALLLLSGIGGKQRDEILVTYSDDLCKAESVPVVPAFYPPVQREDREWEILKRNYRYKFSNNPWEYHNGGIWPMVAGFWAAGLGKAGKSEKAAFYEAEIEKLNRLGETEEDWSFYEWHHPKTGKPGGTKYTTWSAAATIFASSAVKGNHLPI